MFPSHFEDPTEAYLQRALSGNVQTVGGGTATVLPFTIDLGTFLNGILIDNGNGSFGVTKNCSLRVTLCLEAIGDVNNFGWTTLLGKNGAAVPFSNAPVNGRSIVAESDMSMKSTIVDMAVGDSLIAYQFVKEGDPFLGTSTLTSYATAPGVIPAGATLYGSLLIIEALRDQLS